jgi:ureidoglycolate hydrolase
MALRPLPVIPLAAEPLTSTAFAPYGQVIWPQGDDGDWQPGDADLELSQGQPRLYLVRLPARGLRFRELAAHRLVSQCLGVMGPHAWQIAVAPPSLPTDQPINGLSHVRAFTVPPCCILKLHPGTWHAGPLFAHPGELVFCNLELRDTNSQDRLTLPLAEGQEAEIRP